MKQLNFKYLTAIVLFLLNGYTTNGQERLMPIDSLYVNKSGL